LCFVYWRFLAKTNYIKMGNIIIPTLDLVIIVVFLVGITLIGVAQIRKKRETTEAFFLASRNLTWGFIGASLFAANISTIHLVGLAASGFNEGLVWGNFEWLAGVTLIFLALIFAPFYFKSRIQTLPEFLERRYDSRSRTVFAFIAILGALFVHIGLSLYAGAVIFEKFFGINVLTSIGIIALLTLIYYVSGGLKAVVVTQAIQTVILILGAAILTIFGLFALPDIGIYSFAELRDTVKPGQLQILHSMASIKAVSPEGVNSGLTWYACFLGYPVLGLWYWCSDQTIVQQVLAARSRDDAQKGPVFAGFLKILPVFIMVFPGIIGYVLYRDQINDANETLVTLIHNLLPTGLIGIFSAALLAALMSTMAAAINSISTLISVDIFKRIQPQTPEKKLVRIGRMSAVVIMILAAFWSTQGGKFSSIFDAINRVAMALSPPVATVLLFGVLYKRGTKEASLVTLIVGLTLGVIAFIMDFKPITGDLIITNRLGIPFMMQAWWLFCICVVIYLTVSRFTPKPDPEIIKNYTWLRPLDIIRGKITRWNDVRIMVIILVITLIILYVIFS